MAKLTTDTGRRDNYRVPTGVNRGLKKLCRCNHVYKNGPSPYEPGEIVNAYGCSLPYNQDIFVRNDPLARPDWGGAVNNGHGRVDLATNPPGSRYDGGVWSSPCTVMQDQKHGRHLRFHQTSSNSTAPIGTFDVMFLSGGVVLPDSRFWHADANALSVRHLVQTFNRLQTRRRFVLRSTVLARHQRISATTTSIQVSTKYLVT